MNIGTALLVTVGMIYGGSVVFVGWLVWWTVGNMKNRNTSTTN